MIIDKNLQTVMEIQDSCINAMKEILIFINQDIAPEEKDYPMSIIAVINRSNKVIHTCEEIKSLLKNYKKVRDGRNRNEGVQGTDD